ncbi:MAG: hypothetical protein HC824_08415 [Synechococcales cyanobacterium RM1_1_8]|nr:hypothetical protein [Synechococcales cyanobacterium RM1_1_8]
MAIASHHGPHPDAVAARLEILALDLGIEIELADVVAAPDTARPPDQQRCICPPAIDAEAEAAKVLFQGEDVVWASIAVAQAGVAIPISIAEGRKRIAAAREAAEAGCFSGKSGGEGAATKIGLLGGGGGAIASRPRLKPRLRE